MGKHRNNAWIEIDLTTQSESIVFLIKNSQSSSEIDKKGRISGGIGLNNVIKRLDLIYPNNHKLDIETQEKMFHVKLQLKTAQ